MTSRRTHVAIVLRVALLLLACIPVACELMKYSPHQDDLPSSASQINQKNIERILATPPDDTLRIAFVTDTQNHYDETLEFVRSINARDDVDFVVHGGDITHFGIAQEYEWMHEILTKLGVPFLAVIGNHDLLANGGDIYDAVYGKRDFSFIYDRIKFVFIDTNSLQYGFPGDVPDVEWLRDELAPAAEFDRAIVIGHVPADHPDFDDELEQSFGATLEESTTVPLALFGHAHNYSVDQPFGDVTHLVTASAAEREYTLVTISEGDVDYQRIGF